MWCANCQADVATEISADGQSLKCTTCTHEIRRVFAPSLHPETQSARELLDRWAREEQQGAANSGASGIVPRTSPSGTTPKSEPALKVESLPRTESPLSSDVKSTQSVSAESVKSNKVEPRPFIPPPLASSDSSTEGLSSTGSRQGRAEKPFRPTKLRVDGAHESPLPKQAAPAPRANFRASQDSLPTRLSPAAPEPVSSAPVAHLSNSSNDRTPPPEAVSPPPTEPRRPKLRIDAGHTQDQIPAPHVDIRPFAPRTGSRPGRSESLWGQLLAYAGVGGITVGTVLVVWGYFGGIETYASTGWLVATAGQMLLLLGVVTLISGGMTQTTHEVGARIETLDGRIHRIEQSTHQLLKGPHFARKRKRARSRSGAGRPPEAESA